MSSASATTSAVPFDERDGLIWLDGELVPWKGATLHVLSHGLHYSSAVFEGIRVYDCQPFMLAAHSDRLISSATEIDCNLPYNSEQLSAASLAVISEHQLVNGYIRPIAWRGSETMGVGGAKADLHVAIAAWEWPLVFSADARLRGVILRTSRWRRPPPSSAPVRAKGAGQYALGSLARNEAEAFGADDALLLDYRGYLAEATGANLFLVIDGALHTPIPDCFLNGITRQTVIAIARLQGLNVFERHMEVDEIARASEAFLTGTAYEVQSVRSIDSHVFAVNDVTTLIADAYATLVRK